MKILNLEVQGFRSLRHVKNWCPGDLNVLIGPNGAGKSNLLRLIELLSVSAHGRMGKYVQQYGGMEPLLWDGSVEAIDIKVKCSSPEMVHGSEARALTYKLVLERVGRSGEYRIGHELLGNYSKVEQGTTKEPMKYLDRHGLHAKIYGVKERGLTAPEESVPPTETLLSLAADPFTQNPILPRFRGDLASWSVYHDLYTNRDAVIRMPAITRHEKRVAPDGQNLITVLHTLYTGDRDFKKEINAAMRAAFGEDFEELVFAPASDQRIQLRVRWKSLRREQSAGDLSDGTLRFLFLLTVLASPERAPVIAVDEPESGLHPSMLPIIAEYSVEAARHSQVIFTSHSPQFLDAFGNTRPVTTVVRWMEGETNLDVLAAGELDTWLKEYSLGSLFQSGELEGMAV
jgi:predicted ATPase